MAGVMKILLVDDHPFICEGIRKSLIHEPGLEIAGEARNCDEALVMLKKGRFDLVILDISLPGKSGLEFLREVRPKFPMVSFLMLSMHEEREFAANALKNGASGYVSKNDMPSLLVTAIRKIGSGGKFLSPTMMSALADFVQSGNDRDHSRLTKRELETMKRLASGQTYKQIAVALKISEKTTGSYRSRIFLKMGFKTNADLVKYCVGKKLV